MARKGRHKSKRSGNYCWACDCYRANEQFNAKGRRRHICRDCLRLGADELSRIQAFRNIERCFTFEGRLRRRCRKEFKQFLNHPDSAVRDHCFELAEEMGIFDAWLESALNEAASQAEEGVREEYFEVWIESGPDVRPRRLSVTTPSRVFGAWIESGPDEQAWRELIDVWIESGPRMEDIVGVWTENDLLESGERWQCGWRSNYLGDWGEDELGEHTIPY